MDFVTALPKTQKGNNAIWAIVDRLTKYAHFIPFKVGTTLDGLAELYVAETVRVQGLPVSIFLIETRCSFLLFGKVFLKLWELV
ncbi:unnamed protein product [Rhodiola kirilowii]